MTFNYKVNRRSKTANRVRNVTAESPNLSFLNDKIDAEENKYQIKFRLLHVKYVLELWVE